MHKAPFALSTSAQNMTTIWEKGPFDKEVGLKLLHYKL